MSDAPHFCVELSLSRSLPSFVPSAAFHSSLFHIFLLFVSGWISYLFLVAARLFEVMKVSSVSPAAQVIATEISSYTPTLEHGPSKEQEESEPTRHFEESKKKGKANDPTEDLKNCPGLFIAGIAHPNNFEAIRKLPKNIVRRYARCKRNLLSFFRGVNEANSRNLHAIRNRKIIHAKKRILPYIPSDSETEN